jgi:tellurite resistance protein
VEAARAFAENLAASAGNDDQKLEAGFLKVTGRPPVEREMTVLRGTLARERERYRSDRESAEALLAVGEAPVGHAVDPVEHAAMTQVCSLLLNLSETLTRP